jgi:hypothetical protein
MSPAGDALASAPLANQDGGHIEILELATGAVTASDSLDGLVRHLAWAPSGAGPAMVVQTSPCQNPDLIWSTLLTIRRTTGQSSEPMPPASGEGAGHFYGHVTHWDPPVRMAMRTQLGPGTVMDTSYALSDEGEQTLFQMSRVVAGPVSEEEAAGIHQHGDFRSFEEALRAIIEQH